MSTSPPRRSGRHWGSGEQPVVSHAGRPQPDRLGQFATIVAVCRDLALIAVLVWLIAWLVRTGGP